MHICLAGALSRRAWLPSAGVKSVLVSFAELKEKSADRRRQLMGELHRDFEFVFVDSGAHSFHSLAGDVSFRERKTGLGDPDDWMRDYIQFVLENHECADGFAELDIHSVVGIEKVLEYREWALGAGWPREKFVPVYHATIQNEKSVQNLDALWESWCEQFPYVATEGGGGQAKRVVAPGQQRKILEVARKHGARLHGFAMTAQENLWRVPYYSVDSTSWLSGSMYGVVFRLRGNQFKQVRIEDQRRRSRWRQGVLDQLARTGVDVPEEVQQMFLVDEGYGATWINACMFAQLEARLTEQWERRGQHCTCGDPEARGACKFHGLGLSGNPPPIQKGDKQTDEAREKMSIAKVGNLHALVHGKRTSRIPQVQCDTCYLAGRCKGYEEGAVCRYSEDFQGAAEVLGTRNWESLVTLHIQKMQIDWTRYMRSVFFEAADGGLVDKSTSALSAQLTGDEKFLARLLGILQPEGLQVDARQLQVVFQGLSEDSLDKVADSLLTLRREFPQLLELENE